jgi:hypothetical protein
VGWLARGRARRQAGGGGPVDLGLASQARALRLELAERDQLVGRLEADLGMEWEGYVGAEIEQAVIDAMYVGFNEEGREFTAADVSAALGCQVPLSVSQRERIQALQASLRERRAQSTSSSEATDAEREFVPLELGTWREDTAGGGREDG